MIDIELIREKPEFVIQSFKRRGKELPLAEISDLDQRRRAAITEIDSLRSRRNAVSKDLGQSKEKPAELIEEMRNVGSQIKDLEEKERTITGRLNQVMLDVPNLPSESSPDGPDENSNVVIRTVGGIPKFDFNPKPHWEIGENLGIIDFQRGVKLAKTRFYLLKGQGARLQRALISWMYTLRSMDIVNCTCLIW